MATRKMKKFDMGGGVRGGAQNSTSAGNTPRARITPGPRPDQRQDSRDSAAMSAANRAEAAANRLAGVTPNRAFNAGLRDAYAPVIQGREQYLYTPEMQNYRNYMSNLPDQSDLRDQARVAQASGAAMPTIPTLAAYNPNTAYTRPENIKTAGPNAVGMKKGGAVKKMASASKRGDGIAQRGKTKGRMC